MRVFDKRFVECIATLAIVLLRVRTAALATKESAVRNAEMPRQQDSRNADKEFDACQQKSAPKKKPKSLPTNTILIFLINRKSPWHK